MTGAPQSSCALVHRGLSSKVKLGGNVSAAAGPNGRDLEASTDVSMRAEILSDSRARGLFAGVSLEGTSLRPDDNATRSVRQLDNTAFTQPSRRKMAARSSAWSARSPR